MRSARRWIREPLVGFAVLALLLITAHRVLSPERPTQPSTAVVAAMDRDFERRHARPPTPQERADLVQAWVDEELLYREGVRLGLDQGDPIVRRRVVQKVRLLHRAMGADEAPTDEALVAYRDAHLERYRLPAALAFEHVFIADGDLARAEELLLRLREGADADGLGDPFPRGSREPLRGVEAINQAFGQGFGAALNEAGEGWHRVPSAFGLHLVRVEHRVEARTPEVDEIRDVLTLDFNESQADRRERDALQNLRAGR